MLSFSSATSSASSRMWSNCMPTRTSGRSGSGTSSDGCTRHVEPVWFDSSGGTTLLPNTRLYSWTLSGMSSPSQLRPRSSLVAWNASVGSRDAKLYASPPRIRSMTATSPFLGYLPLNATDDWILRFESRPSTTSNCRPGFMSATLVHSVP